MDRGVSHSAARAQAQSVREHSRALPLASPLRLGTSRAPFPRDRGVSHSAARAQAQSVREHSRTLSLASPLRLGTSRAPKALMRPTACGLDVTRAARRGLTHAWRLILSRL